MQLHYLLVVAIVSSRYPPLL